MKIVNLDHYARGICKVDNKIVFVENALVDEDIEYKIIREHKNYDEAVVSKILTKSAQRIKPICPYYNECGGCATLHMKYADSLNFKVSKLKNIFAKYNKLNLNIQVLGCQNNFYYRNKGTFKIVNKKVGYYQSKTHKFIAIDKCYLLDSAINEVIAAINNLHLDDGQITIRSNYNKELLISISTNTNAKYDFEKLINDYKVAGIVLNDKIVYNDDKFVEKIDKYLYQVSYNSFFQVNLAMASNLIKLILDNIQPNSVIADLFCGVGSISIAMCKKAKKVYGIEIVNNAVLNALVNKQINYVDNLEIMLGDANKLIFKIQDKIDIVVVDPPRCGLSKDGLKALLNLLPSKIIYVSCNPMTLSRDINTLKDMYQIDKFYMLDMFANTYHVESMVLMSRKKT